MEILTKQWAQFHSQWLQLQEQINTATHEWTPENIQKEYFYSQLFLSLKKNNDLIKRLATDENVYLSSRKLNPLIEAKIEYDTQVARKSLENFRAQLLNALQTPPTLNGMPQKLGL